MQILHTNLMHRYIENQFITERLLDADVKNTLLSNSNCSLYLSCLKTRELNIFDCFLLASAPLTSDIRLS